MNLQTISETVYRLQATKSSNEKIAILNEQKHNTDLKNFFKLVLDESVMFWITPPEDLPAKSGSEHIVIDRFFNEFSERKVTGNAARKALFDTLLTLTKESQDMLIRVFGRDAKCGVADGTVNKVWDKWVSVFKPMKGYSIDDYAECIEDLDPALIIGRQASIKLDGRRTFIFKDKDSVYFQSSSGKPVYNLEEVIPEVLALPIDTGVIDCEFFDTDWASSSSVSSSKVNKKTSDTWKLYGFDILTMDEWNGNGRENFAERDALLANLLRNGNRLIRAPDLGIVKSIAHLRELFDKAVGMGYEGLMLKLLNYMYQRDRVEAWLKAKPVETVDVQIIDIVNGKKGKKYENTLGAFVCKDKNGITFECGIGFKGSLADDKRNELWYKRGELIGTFIEVLQDKLPDRKAMKTRFPRFMKLRPDKNSF